MSELGDLILEESYILSNFVKLALELFLDLIFLTHHLLMKLIQVPDNRVPICQLVHRIILLLLCPLHGLREVYLWHDLHLRWGKDRILQIFQKLIGNLVDLRFDLGRQARCTNNFVIGRVIGIILRISQFFCVRSFFLKL